MNRDLAHEHISLEQLEHWAAHYAQTQQTEALAVTQKQWLLFYVAGELFTVTVNALDEICSPGTGTALPQQLHGALGLINIRGEPILLADMGILLSLRAAPPQNTQQRILIFKDDLGRKTGFLVDSLLGIKTLSDTHFKDNTDQSLRYIHAIGEYQTASECRGISQLNISAMLAQLSQ